MCGRRRTRHPISSDAVSGRNLIRIYELFQEATVWANEESDALVSPPHAGAASFNSISCHLYVSKATKDNREIAFAKAKSSAFAKNSILPFLRCCPLGEPRQETSLCLSSAETLCPSPADLERPRRKGFVWLASPKGPDITKRNF